MKHEKKLKGYEAVWTCDFCGKESKTKRISDVHELKCIKNPQNTRFLILVGVLLFLGALFCVDFVVKAKEKSNSTPQKIEEPTPTITPTLIPTLKPKTQNTSSNTNSSQIECIGPDGKHFNTSMTECKNLAEKWGKSVDYMVICTYPVECGGGEHRIAKSECDKPCERTQNNSVKNDTSNYVMVALYGDMPVWCKPEVVQALKDMEVTMREKSKLWADTCVSVVELPSSCTYLKDEANRAEDAYKDTFMHNCVNNK